MTSPASNSNSNSNSNNCSNRKEEDVKGANRNNINKEMNDIQVKRVQRDDMDMLLHQQRGPWNLFTISH